MTRGIVIAGNESALASAIEVEVARRVEHFAAALIPNRLAGADAASRPLSRRLNAQDSSSAAGAEGQAVAEKARIPLNWNPASPISARALVLAAEHRLERIDEAILVCDPPSIRRSAVELSPVDVEILAGDYIKGWFFAARELAALFRARGAGSLALVCPDAGSGNAKDDSADVFRSAALAVFRALSQSLLASAAGSPFVTMGFSGAEDGDEAGFAAFVVKLLEEGTARNNGKLHKYGKLSIFK